jgi:hypothetical protein
VYVWCKEKRGSIHKLKGPEQKRDSGFFPEVIGIVGDKKG